MLLSGVYEVVSALILSIKLILEKVNYSCLLRQPGRISRKGLCGGSFLAHYSHLGPMSKS
jgi:hypothetical protein